MILIDDIIEVLFGIALFANACLFIPQTVRLLQHKDASGLSLTTFLGFNVINLLTIMHGVIKQDILLITGYVVSAVTNGSVTWLIIWYRYLKST